MTLHYYGCWVISDALCLSVPEFFQNKLHILYIISELSRINSICGCIENILAINKRALPYPFTYLNSEQSGQRLSLWWLALKNMKNSMHNIVEGKYSKEYGLSSVPCSQVWWLETLLPFLLLFFKNILQQYMRVNYTLRKVCKNIAQVNLT